MSKSEMRVAYIGSAVDGGTMDVRQLAPAMLALGSVCERAHSILTGQEKGVSVSVQSNFKHGSFEFMTMVTMSGQFVPLFSSAPPPTAEYLLALLGMAKSETMGLIGLVKALRGQRPMNISQEGDGNVAVMAPNAKNAHVVNQHVRNFYGDSAIRKGLGGIVKPLENGGVNGVEFRDAANGKVVEQIGENEVAFFRTPEQEDVIENVDKVLLKLETIQLSGDRQWGFRRGVDGGILKAKIHDANFTRKMTKGEVRFAYGDTILALLHEEQRMEGGEVKSKYEVLEVLKYFAGGENVPLDFTAGRDE